MLKEITLDELKQRLGQIRIMVEEDPDHPEPGQGQKAERTLKHSTENEEKVLKAWRRGERTIAEVVKETGLSYPTVRKYLPESPKG